MRVAQRRFELTFLVLASTLLSCASAPPSAPETSTRAIGVWADQNHEVAHELGNWARANIQAMRHLSRWERQEPALAHEFLVWTVRNPTQSIDVFSRTRPHDPVLNEIFEHHRSAADWLMWWCRKYRPATESLASYDGGLLRVGNHLYRL
jgi:hypothetical protein